MNFELKTKEKIIKGNEYKSPLYNLTEHKHISFEQGIIVDAYLAPSYTQKNHDLHLWFKTSKGQQEIFFNDIYTIDQVFNQFNARVYEDFIGKESIVAIAENKDTKHKIVSAIIDQKYYLEILD
jgi:hypothetical protein